jgi:hypothetical protein
MNKKYIGDLTKEELVKVFETNEKLRNDVSDDMVESEHLYAEEQMDFVRGSARNWSIGPGGHNYIGVSNADAFIVGLKEMDDSVPAFTDEEAKEIDAALKLREEYREEEMYTDVYDQLEEQLEEEAQKLADKLAAKFQRRFQDCFNRENKLDYFLDFYADTRLDADCYIIEGDYTLYQTVTNSFR